MIEDLFINDIHKHVLTTLYMVLRGTFLVVIILYDDRH